MSSPKLSERMKSRWERVNKIAALIDMKKEDVWRYLGTWEEEFPEYVKDLRGGYSKPL